MRYHEAPRLPAWEGWFVIDVGAYVGIYSLWVARLVGDEGLVIALELNPVAYRYLISNLELNRARNMLLPKTTSHL